VTETTPMLPTNDDVIHQHETEEYAGGTIQSQHGYLPVWLLVVYAVLFVWGLYYAYNYWGGLGPGRIY
jgi:hypothetical protein